MKPARVGALTRQVRRKLRKEIGHMPLLGPTESNRRKYNFAKVKKRNQIAAESRRRNRT